MVVERGNGLLAHTLEPCSAPCGKWGGSRAGKLLLIYRWKITQLAVNRLFGLENDINQVLRCRKQAAEAVGGNRIYDRVHLAKKLQH